MGADGSDGSYCRTLADVVRVLGEWAAHWILCDPVQAELDPELLVLWMSRHVRMKALPARPAVVAFDLIGPGPVPGRTAHLPRLPQRSVGRADRTVPAVPGGQRVFDVIPVNEHFQPLFRLPPAIAPPLATMTSLFVLLITYGTRDTSAPQPMSGWAGAPSRCHGVRRS
jgi:hypothetical protein